MVELTRKQKIGFGFGAAGVLVVTAIVVIYFVFFNKKDTPKPTPKPTSKSTSTPTSTSTSKPTSTPTSTPTQTNTQISNNIKSIYIKGIKLKNNEIVEYKETFHDSTEYETFKNQLFTKDDGCWSFFSHFKYPDAFIDECYITEVTLPSDIKAIASGSPLVLGGPTGLCDYTMKTLVEAGKTTNFTIDDKILRLKFMKA
jgi:hypothetical protein